MKKTFLLAYLFLCLACLPTQASNPQNLPTLYPIQQKIVRFAVKQAQKRHDRLERKLAKTDSPEKIARIKKKQEITTLKVIIFFLGVLAGLTGLVGLAFNATSFSNICFLIMVCCFGILFPNLFRGV